MSNVIKGISTAIKQTTENIAKGSISGDIVLIFEFVSYTTNQGGNAGGKIYVADYHRFEKASGAQTYISSMVSAGGRAKENVKQALATFHSNHDFSIPSIVFLITDDGYHKNSSTSKSATEERKTLTDMIYPVDIFEIFDRYPKEKLFFYPMLFTSAQDYFQDYATLATQALDGCATQFETSKFTSAMMKELMLYYINNILKRVMNMTLVKDNVTVDTVMRIAGPAITIMMLEEEVDMDTVGFTGFNRVDPPRKFKMLKFDEAKTQLQAKTESLVSKANALLAASDAKLDSPIMYAFHRLELSYQ